MKYLVLAQFDDFSQEYWDFDEEKDARLKLKELKRFSGNIEHLWVVETKPLEHWANPDVSVSSEQ